MTHSLRPVALALSLCSLLPSCVINGDDDDDDGAGDSSEGGSSPSTSNTSDPGTSNGTTAGTTDTTTAGTTATTTTAGTSETASTTEPATTGESESDSESDSDPTTDPDSESGVDVDPQDGSWEYDETGQTTNDCTFIAEPSNGFGEYLVANTGGGGFTITPGDSTDPFTCTHGGGAFSCDERLTGTYDIGMGLGDATGNILVAIEGTLDSATMMSAEQQGRIECEGADCGTAAGLLGVTFPCEFTIPFVGTAL